MRNHRVPVRRARKVSAGRVIAVILVGISALSVDDLVRWLGELGYRIGCNRTDNYIVGP